MMVGHMHVDIDPHVTNAEFHVVVYLARHAIDPSRCSPRCRRGDSTRPCSCEKESVVAAGVVTLVSRFHHGYLLVRLSVANGDPERAGRKAFFSWLRKDHAEHSFAEMNRYVIWKTTNRVLVVCFTLSLSCVSFSLNDSMRIEHVFVRANNFFVEIKKKHVWTQSWKKKMLKGSSERRLNS